MLGWAVLLFPGTHLVIYCIYKYLLPRRRSSVLPLTSTSQWPWSAEVTPISVRLAFTVPKNFLTIKHSRLLVAFYNVGAFWSALTIPCVIVFLAWTCFRSLSALIDTSLLPFITTTHLSKRDVLTSSHFSNNNGPIFTPLVRVIGFLSL